MGTPKVQETNEQKQNRIRAQEENIREIQQGVADRTLNYSRRARGRRSLITGGTTQRVTL